MLTPRNHYCLACCHAQLAAMAAEAGSSLTVKLGKVEAGNAMVALRQVVAAGFSTVGRLRSDASLDTLRPRADFQKLMKEVEATAPKTPEVARRHPRRNERRWTPVDDAIKQG
jgi:hypothetical protein